MKPNKNYTKDAVFIIVEGKEYPLLKTSNKMAFYMKDDEIKRIKIDKATFKGGE